MSAHSPDFFRSAADRDLALASTTLNGTLLAMLLHKGVLTPAEGNFVAAAAAFACRGQGHEEAAELIEAMMPTCLDVNVEQAAQEMGLDMEKARVQ
jgi:hypothetical protein